MALNVLFFTLITQSIINMFNIAFINSLNVMIINLLINVTLIKSNEFINP